MATAETTTRRDLKTRLIEKAWKDPVFKKEVVTDPKSIFEKFSGHKLPVEVKIYVHEEDANTLHFSIPPAPSNVRELSDEDLEKVAGGTDVLVTMGIAAAATLVATGVASAAGVTAAHGW